MPFSATTRVDIMDLRCHSKCSFELYRSCCTFATL